MLRDVGAQILYERVVVSHADESRPRLPKIDLVVRSCTRGERRNSKIKGYHTAKNEDGKN